MTPLESLDPVQRATLQLVLQQGRTYEEIAGLLGIDEAAVRERAHAGLAALGPESARLDAERRAQLSDYLLGQQSDAERQATLRYLADSAGGRAWARSVSSELAPAARDPLPEIPAGNGASAPAGDAAEDEAEAPAVKPADPVRDGARPRSSRLGGALLLAGVGILVAVVVVLLISGGSGDDDDGGAATQATGGTQTEAAGDQPQPIAQVNLRSTDEGGRAVGVAQVLRQQNQLALAIVAQRLQPNTRRNAYAVWLYSSPQRARLLGFVDPPVGRDRQFSNFQALPRDAGRFREVIVSRERRQTERPTTIVLRGPLRLRGAGGGGAGGGGQGGGGQGGAGQGGAGQGGAGQGRGGAGAGGG